MANFITISRLPLLFIYIAVLYNGQNPSLYWNVPFILLIILLDAVDGWVARKRSETSLLGSVLDIAVDRTVEFLLWIVFADLDLIPVIVPVIVITRGTVVDAIRAMGLKQGISAFDQIQSPINRFLVSSRFMRALYGFTKAAAFTLLTLSWALNAEDQTGAAAVENTALIMTGLSVLICLLRGIPVLLEAVTSGLFTKASTS